MAAHLVVDLGSDGAHDWLGQMCQDVGTALPTSRDNSWPKLEFQRPESQQIFSLAGIDHRSLPVLGSSPNVVIFFIFFISS